MAFYNVAPRYTPGSPAAVNYAIAERVALQEKEAIDGFLSGLYGSENKAKAELFGLRGIVEYKKERGSGKMAGWIVQDLITKETRFFLSRENLRRAGWKEYCDLDQYDRDTVEKSPPVGKGDFRKYGWFKPVRHNQIDFYDPRPE